MDDNEQTVYGWVPGGANKLSHVELGHGSESARDVTFFSIGKDLNISD